MARRAVRTRRTDIHGRDYFVWVASSGYGDGCGHDHPTKRLAAECARLHPRFSPDCDCESPNDDQSRHVAHVSCDCPIHAERVNVPR